MTIRTLNAATRIRWDWTNSFSDRWTSAPIAPERGATLGLRQFCKDYWETHSRNNTNEWTAGIALRTTDGWTRCVDVPLRQLVLRIEDAFDGMDSWPTVEIENDGGRQ